MMIIYNFYLSCILLAADTLGENEGNPLLLKTLPFVGFMIVMYFFVFRRQIKAAKNLGQRIDSNKEPAADHSLIRRWYLKALGTLVANTLGRSSGYSADHMRYLSS